MTQDSASAVPVISHRRPLAKGLAIGVLRAASDGLADRLLLWTARRHHHRLSRRLGLDRIQAIYAARYGMIIQGGPFKMMKYIGQPAGSVGPAKLIGSYEMELHDVLNAAIAAQPPVVVDVGAAEGYYAVGLAKALPHAQVYAFDTDPKARELCLSMACINGVAHRVHVKGRCEPCSLSELLIPGAFLMCDCEGYEAELLNPAEAKNLLSTNIVVELHEQTRPGITSLIAKRFSRSHSVTLIDAVPRDTSEFDSLEIFSAADRELAVNEMRQAGQQWAVLKPNA